MPAVVDIPLLLERLGIQAQRRGREWWACCPLPGHEERTPSWQIRDTPDEPERHGLWRCLGQCHEGGTAAELARRVLGLDSVKEAHRWLREGAIALERPAQLGGVELVPPARPAFFAPGFKLPAGVVVAPLDAWPRIPREYVLNERGITAEQVERWGLGYAVDGRLHGRIVMPWRSRPAGPVTGYTARAYLPGLRKYFEPKEDEGAEKGAVYGEEHWPPLAEREVVVVVEGGIDGFAVERATGFPFAAARGSNLVPAHVAKLSTFQRLIVASDPDAAGRKFAAALRAALGRWKPIEQAAIPLGFDPAKLVQKRGAAALREALGVAVDVVR